MRLIPRSWTRGSRQGNLLGLLLFGAVVFYLNYTENDAEEAANAEG
jgi:hypothetical protein